MIKASKKKPARTSSEPKPLKTTWLDDDFYQSSTKEFSYAKMYTRYYVFDSNGVELYCFKKREDAELQVEMNAGAWMFAHEPSEEVAHNMRQQELAEKRWEGGYGA